MSGALSSLDTLVVTLGVACYALAGRMTVDCAQAPC